MVYCIIYFKYLPKLNQVDKKITGKYWVILKTGFKVVTGNTHNG